MVLAHRLQLCRCYLPDPQYTRFIALGELLLRLSTPRGDMFVARPNLAVDVGGSEANVAIALAALGHDCAIVSAVPANALGDSAVAAMRGGGVDCSAILRSEGRMGLYWVESGAGNRPADVIYDREGSAFAKLDDTAFDWPTLFAGADRLHLSGITVALGDQPTKLAIDAADYATANGIPISFDGNYRAQLWAARGGVDVASLVRLVASADILFGNYKDIALLLGTPMNGSTPDERTAASKAAFAAFPKLRLIASTSRRTESADHQKMLARVDMRDGSIETEEADIPFVVDRIGSGDAFAAGILHADRLGVGIAEVARHGLALAVLKHTVRGDNASFGQRHLARFVDGAMDVQR